MRTFGIIATIFSSLALIGSLSVKIIGEYQYEKQYGAYWELAVKASSIEKKIEGIDKFVEALNNSNLTGKHNAIFMETPNNSFDENFEALKSLQSRLHEIREMDIKSFEYQTALQQITGQEQDEASKMLAVFSGIWWKENHFFLWDWVAILQIFSMAILLTAGIYYWSDEFYF